jgi:YHS domain-containing protein
MKQQDRLGQEMTELMQREVAFTKTAARLMSAIVRPCLEELAGHFENASISTLASDGSRRCHIHFDHCDRFPATVDVQTTLLPDEAIQNLIVTIDVQILPVFIKFDHHNQLVLSLREAHLVNEQRAAAWLEDKLVQFVSDYLTIEHTEQYHQHNYAIDPVCGMKILKTDALRAQHGGQTVYFCAAVCRNRFVDDPNTFSQASQKSS